MSLSPDVQQRLLKKLGRLYGDRATETFSRLRQIVERYASGSKARPAALWDQRDVVLITYGDQVRESDSPPLCALERFLAAHGLFETLRIVHLLPFFPYSSDDGFSVVDYRTVNPQWGDWQDVDRLRTRCDLMVDLVLNHCSRQHAWFRAFVEGREPYTRWFIEVDPNADLSQVVRPRSTPLLTPVETARGVRYVWTTFSADQVDLNFANPDVLLEFLDILLFYVIEHGARIVRLDAIAYLWKKLGTPCIHLPETHLVVKLMRELLDAVAPGTLLLTETNVPHQENISYFGEGDEAHLVYQFSLPPMLLDAYLAEDTGPMTAWLKGLDGTPPGTSFLNFTASHDGIGVRPLEGLVSQERFDRLVAAVRDRGGLVSTRRTADGSDKPYELNTTWYSALDEPGGLPVDLLVRQFLATQAVMASLKGIPAVYFHSLVGTPNDHEGVRRTGQARAINRRKFQRDELEAMLADRSSPQSRIFDGMRRMLAIRVAQPAFHPDASQQVLEFGDGAILAFRRSSLDDSQQILVLANVTRRQQDVDLTKLGAQTAWRDLLADEREVDAREIRLGPWQVAWLEAV